ncbi:MAG: hypothetical protein QME72_11885 [Rhodococcus sp. (in: high G+C Gram-positive bacteria)]|nr:hypothetical protein [Rhodococcus sp. (in: high G+C Gram-positive bacteria)]MDI6628410.1 hypothetical protein [Rhodococcus sp. (in: high G+C Gram-positive bacteria)]
MGLKQLSGECYRTREQPETTEPARPLLRLMLWGRVCNAIGDGAVQLPARGRQSANWRQGRGMRFSDVRPSEVRRWVASPGSMIARSAIFGVAALIALYLCAVSAVEGMIASALSTFGFAVLCISTMAFAWTNVPSIKTGSDVRRWVQGSTVRYNPLGLRLLVVIVSSLSICVIAMGFTSGGVGWVLAAMGLSMASFLIPILLRSIRNGYLELSDDGIRHRGWAFDIQVPWVDVRDTAVVVESYPLVLVRVDEMAKMNRRFTTLLWRIEIMPKGKYIELDCRRFDVHPVALEQWIRFYIDNPEVRVELGTDAAAERLMSFGEQRA